MSTVDQTLASRVERYGDFGSVAASAQRLKIELECSPRWGRMEPYQREALHMIATKVARLLHGDPDHIDSWHDIAGYAQLVEQQLERELGRVEQIERREEHQVREMRAALGADDASGCPASGDRDDEDDPD